MYALRFSPLHTARKYSNLNVIFNQKAEETMIQKFMNLLVFFLLLLFLNGCESKDPSVYNDAIITEQEMVTKSMLQLMETFPSDSSELMEGAYLRLVEQVSMSIDSIKSMGDFEGDTHFRDTAIELFEFYDKVIENEMREMLTILQKGKDNITPEDVERLTELQQQMSKEEQIHDLEFSNAQKEFADKFGLELTRGEIQDKIDNLQ